METEWTHVRGPDRKTFGERLRERRKALGYTRQKDLHAALSGAEGRPNTVSDWETGSSVPSAENAVALADVLDCNVHWLLTGEGSPEPIEGGGAELTLDVIRALVDPSHRKEMIERARRLLDLPPPGG